MSDFISEVLSNFEELREGRGQSENSKSSGQKIPDNISKCAERLSVVLQSFSREARTAWEVWGVGGGVLHR